ncbi:MAG: helix-turn-helix domain-containing protein [Dehalococcoidia bacterium]|nr:helix-turn-helix domain-containing protein [Dehalococcoidia bacterium]
MPLASSQEHHSDQEGATDGEPVATPSATVAPRKPAFLQQERWKVVQKARRKGMSLRTIERELGIHRSTVRSYLEAGGPPNRKQMMPTRCALAEPSRCWAAQSKHHPPYAYPVCHCEERSDAAISQAEGRFLRQRDCHPPEADSQ